MTLLHEENHVGDFRAGRAYAGPDPFRLGDPGSDFIDDVYRMNGQSATDGDFETSFFDPDWQAKLLNAGKRIRRDKKSRGQEADLPGQGGSQNQNVSDMSWSDFNDWIIKALDVNPNIKVTIV
jgi:hypothetical protein